MSLLVLAVHHEIGVEIHSARNRYLVPAAARHAAAAVALVLDKKGDLAHQAVVVDQKLRQPYAGIEIDVVHGQRVFKHIPHALLRVEQKQIGVKRQHTAREALRDAHLKFHIAVGLVGTALAHRGAHCEIVVFVKPEKRAVVVVAAYRVGIKLAAGLGHHDLPLKAQREYRQRHDEQDEF